MTENPRPEFGHRIYVETNLNYDKNKIALKILIQAHIFNFFYFIINDAHCFPITNL